MRGRQQVELTPKEYKAAQAATRYGALRSLMLELERARTAGEEWYEWVVARRRARLGDEA